MSSRSWRRRTRRWWPAIGLRRSIASSRAWGAAAARGLAGVPEEFAEAVELHDLHGLNYLEIAQVTSTAIGTVMSRRCTEIS